MHSLLCNQVLFSTVVQAPITYERVNLTTTVGVAHSATVTLDNCTFSCSLNTGVSGSYQIVARVWSPLELLGSLNFLDSRLILFQRSLTTANSSWGQAPVLIANSRYDNDTSTLVQSVALGLINITFCSLTMVHASWLQSSVYLVAARIDNTRPMQQSACMQASHHGWTG